MSVFISSSVSTLWRVLLLLFLIAFLSSMIYVVVMSVETVILEQIDHLYLNDFNMIIIDGTYIFMAQRPLSKYELSHRCNPF